MITVFRTLCVHGAAVLALAIPKAIAAQGVADTTVADPALDIALEAEVRARISETWEVPAERLVLQPGSIRDGWSAPARPSVELLGSGSGGNWVVRVADADDDAVEAESFRLRAGVLTPVTVAAHPLARGKTLTEADLGREARVVWGAPHADAETPVQVGWVTARVIDKGDELQRPAVHPPLAVRSGAPVQLLWKRGAVSLRVAGRAAGSAAIGEDVRVRTESGQRLQGRVVAPGVVDVTGPGSER